MAINTFQRMSKHGKPVINEVGLPVFKLPIEKRLKLVRGMVNQGLSKADSVWNNVVSNIKMLKL
jgi:hypothetical protein